MLEQHGYPPLVLSFESIDELDHVIFVYRRRGRWGSIARSRDPGLHGRKPVFATPRALALSYVDPYVDFTGRVTGYAVVDLAQAWATTTGAWRRRTSGRSSACCSITRTRIKTSDARFRRLKRRYREYREANGGRKPLELPGPGHVEGAPVRIPVESSEMTKWPNGQMAK